MKGSGMRPTIITTVVWASLVLVAQVIYVAVLVPLLPAAYSINLAPRPFGFEAQWDTEQLVLIGWVCVVATAVIAGFAVYALSRGDAAGGLGAAFAVALAAPLIVTLQLSNAIVELTDASTSIPVYLVLVALAAGLFSFFGLPRSRATRRRRSSGSG